MPTDFQLKCFLAKLEGFSIETLHDSVFLAQFLKPYGWGYHDEFSPFDDSMSAKAFCLDLIQKYGITYHPARDTQYRFGSYGPYVRIGSHQPVKIENGNLFRAVALCLFNTFGNAHDESD